MRKRGSSNVSEVFPAGFPVGNNLFALIFSDFSFRLKRHPEIKIGIVNRANIGNEFGPVFANHFMFHISFDHHDGILVCDGIIDAEILYICEPVELNTDVGVIQKDS